MGRRRRKKRMKEGGRRRGRRRKLERRACPEEEKGGLHSEVWFVFHTVWQNQYACEDCLLMYSFFLRDISARNANTASVSGQNM